MSEDNKKQDDFMGYAMFNFVQDRKLKAFNRLTTFFIVVGKETVALGQKYIEAFDKEGKQDIEKLYKDIKVRGLSKIRLEIMEGKHYG